jgi:FkbM family methyltransferase
MAVRSFNHPSEIEPLAGRFDVELIPVEGGSARSFTPIKAMLDWATERDAHVMIINADIELRMAPWELNRARWLSDGGLCYFVRYNHDGDLRRVVREPHGIDAFLLHGRHGRLFPDTSLCMGQPAWDYLVPHTFASRGLPISTVEFPAAFHREHPVRWSATDWHRGALELDRVTGLLGDDRSYGACIAMTTRMRQEFDRGKVALSERPIEIRRWVERTFNYPGAKTFLELGAHRGTDTVWMAELPGVVVHAFEPDPRNRMPPLPNVIMNHAAISDREGRIPFLLSGHNRGQEWTYSSSIKRPKRHLDRYPVTFEETVEVDTVTLDGYCRRRGLEVIDFIWADIQGAEGEMVRGGQEALARTRYLFTEYSDDELYEGQATLADLLRMLPDFRVLELYDEDVLLENTALMRGGSLA